MKVKIAAAFSLSYIQFLTQPKLHLKSLTPIVTHSRFWANSTHLYRTFYPFLSRWIYIPIFSLTFSFFDPLLSPGPHSLFSKCLGLQSHCRTHTRTPSPPGGGRTCMTCRRSSRAPFCFCFIPALLRLLSIFVLKQGLCTEMLFL